MTNPNKPTHKNEEKQIIVENWNACISIILISHKKKNLVISIKWCVAVAVFCPTNIGQPHIIPIIC